MAAGRVYAPRRAPITVTVDPATEDRLQALSEASGQARGRVLDALLTHARGCSCPVCAHLDHERHVQHETHEDDR